MFNLLISNELDSWEHGTYEIDRSRVAIEYTAVEITERYRSLDDPAMTELKSFPCIFSIENEPIPSRIGYITDIHLRTKTLVIKFEFDAIFPPLPAGAIEQLRSEIDLGKWELSRTHWAIKDETLMEILVRRNFVSQKQVETSHALKLQTSMIQQPPRIASSPTSSNRVFIVHGHDEIAKLDADRFVLSCGLEPIILNQQASAGMTIIEKIEYYSDVGFGIILYTPCDFGAKVGAMTSSFRARQNVIFEHGYLIAKLGRNRVAALVKGQLETPNDISGIVYVTMDDSASWESELKTELSNTGYAV